MKFEFNAVAGGDMECFCFYVDKETFIRLAGQDAFNTEVEHLKSWYEECNREPGAEPFVEPTEWPIYPHVFFNSSKNLNIKIEVEELPSEEI
jgi:hypothetical protein